MVFIDFVVLAIIIISMIVGFLRGLVKEAFSLTGWLLALWIAMTFSSGMAELFGQQFKEPNIRYLAAFVTLFVLTLVVAAIANFFARQLIQKTGLSGIDQTLGVVFGFFRGILLVTVIVIALGFTEAPKQKWWDESFFLFRFEVIATWLKDLLPAEVTRYLNY